MFRFRQNFCYGRSLIDINTVCSQKIPWIVNFSIFSWTICKTADKESANNDARLHSVMRNNPLNLIELKIVILFCKERVQNVDACFIEAASSKVSFSVIEAVEQWFSTFLSSRNISLEKMFGGTPRCWKRPK
jgi:hypothetical protein